MVVKWKSCCSTEGVTEGIWRMQATAPAPPLRAFSLLESFSMSRRSVAMPAASEEHTLSALSASKSLTCNHLSMSCSTPHA